MTVFLNAKNISLRIHFQTTFFCIFSLFPNTEITCNAVDILKHLTLQQIQSTFSNYDFAIIAQICGILYLGPSPFTRITDTSSLKFVSTAAR